MTNVTLVRFLARVDQHVGIQFGLLSESHQALFTLVRSLAGVNHGMPNQFRLSLVRFLTNVTRVRLFAAVRQHVIVERSFLGERSMTQRTLEMLVPRVERQVHIQFRLLFKCLEADRTFIGLVRIRVIGHVSIQINFLLKRHVTHVTFEGPVLHLHYLLIHTSSLHKSLLQRVAVVRFVQHMQLHMAP